MTRPGVAVTTVRVGRRAVEVSNRDKVFFPAAGITKGAVVDYYRKVAPVILPYLRDRPLTLHRFPDGLTEDGFYQQARPDYFPDWVGSCRVARAEGRGKVDHAVVENAAALVYLANQAVLVFHAWLATVDALDRPDRMVFDLDPPGEGDDFGPVRRAALLLRDFLDEAGCTAFPMSTGSRGVHVVVPLDRSTSFDDTRQVAARIADLLAGRHPDTLTTEQRKKKREGRLYLDVMRNAGGQTAVVPYSLRARPGAPVATPLTWDELSRGDTGPRSYTLENLFRRLGQRDDPWKGMRRHALSAVKLGERLPEE